MMKHTLAAAALVLVMQGQARADDFTDYLRTEITRMDDALNSAVASNLEASEAWDFTNFYLRLQAAVGFSVPRVLNVNVVPNLELVWHKLPQQPKP